MSNLVELGDRILAVLDDLDSDNVFALMNTIIKPTGGRHEVADLQAAVQALVAKRMVKIFMDGRTTDGAGRFDDGEVSKLFDDLQAWFQFDQQRARWTLSKGDLRTAALPSVLITEEGKRVSHDLLEDRGYNWWR